MKAFQLTAVVLIVLGVLALAYGGFTYTSDTHEANLGPISVVVDEKKHVSVPIWAGAGAVVAGGLLLLFGARR
ncbi:MAG: hypothetical protein RQ729_07685 [Wenzhouxiangellaceae bacterium]|nr:hypothetical protein [Wenzhouxiangellaceae bacterium]